MSSPLAPARPPAATGGPATAATLLLSAYPWEADRAVLPLGVAVQRADDLHHAADV